MTNLISIIIPMYNSSKYIHACLNSILTQTYTYLEVIVIDDGSTDESFMLVNEISKKDKRIKLYQQKKNGGVSSARNLGIKYATGDYITFVDSDDSIEPDMYEKMLSHFNDDVDVVCCGVNRFDNNGNFIGKFNCIDNEFLFSGKQAIALCLEGKTLNFAVYDKIYKAKLFKKFHLQFPVGKTMEEARIFPKLFAHVNMVYHIGKPKYNYYLREGSYTTKPICKEVYNIYNMIDEYYQIYKNDKKIIRQINLFKYRNCIILYRAAILQKAKIEKEVYKTIKTKFNQNFFPALFSSISIKYKLIAIETFLHFHYLRKKHEKK